MSVGRFILGQQFTVSSIDIVVDAPTRLNIKKRKENVIYRTLSDIDNINLEYVIGKETNSLNNLFISDRSTSLVQNRIPSASELQLQETAVVTLAVDKFLITDVFTPELPTKPATPLFFVHYLVNFDPEDPSQSLLNIEFANSNLQPRKVSEYLIDTSTGGIYNNIENEYSITEGSFDVTFIKYTIRTVVGSTQSIEIFHELISNESIFTPASFDDIDEWGYLLPGLKKYIIQTTPGGSLFEVFLPLATTYAVKEVIDSRLKILPPVAQTLSLPWYIRISNGNFLASLQKTRTGLFGAYRYGIAEFDSQSFQPQPPFKLQPQEEAIWLSKFLIKVSKNIVIDSTLSMHLDIIIRDKKNVLKFAYTSDTSKINTLYPGQSTVYYTNGILSIDQLNGFIELSDTIRDDDVVIVAYYTEEKEYEFTRVDFNPINNIDILTQRIVVYIAPESSSSGELDKSLHYLVVDEQGIINYSSQAAEGSLSLDTATHKLLQEDFNTDGSPKHLFYYDQESTVSGLESRYTDIPNSGIFQFSFKDKYSVESVLLQNTSSGIVNSTTGYLNYQENSRFLILGDIYVGENQSIESLTTFDIREQGGGIKDEFREESLLEQAEVSWYWDFFGVRPYPSMGAFFAEIPQSILQEWGGDFTHEQVRDIVSRHMGLGGYAVIDYYDVDPVIIESVTTSGSLMFAWPSYGEDVTYNTYYSKDPEKNFIQINPSVIEDVSSGNYIIVSGLTPGANYFVKVAATRDEIISESQIVKLATDSIEES